MVVFVVILLVGVVVGDVVELVQVYVDFNVSQIVYGVVVIKGCMVGVRSFCEQWEVGSVLEKWVLIDVQVGIGVQLVGGIQQVGNFSYLVVWVFGLIILCVVLR